MKLTPVKALVADRPWKRLDQRFSPWAFKCRALFDRLYGAVEASCSALLYLQLRFGRR